MNTNSTENTSSEYSLANARNTHKFNSETLEAMTEADQGHNLCGPYNNAAEMFEDILGEQTEDED